MVITTSEEFLSPQEVGDRLGASVYTVRRWIKTGALPAYKPGKEYRVREADLQEFLRAREVRPKAPRRSPSEPSFNDVLAEERREADMTKHLPTLSEVHEGWLSEFLRAAEMRRVCIELFEDGSVELRGYRT